MIKKVKKSPNKKSQVRGSATRGTIFIVAIMSIVVAAGTILTGGISPKLKAPSLQADVNDKYACCDSGDGVACKPSATKKFNFNGTTYGLLKSNIVHHELKHVEPTNKFTPDGHRIFLNKSDEVDLTARHGSPLKGSNCKKGKDYIRTYDAKLKGEPYYGGYFCIPNDQIIYVCKDTKKACDQEIKKKSTPFDVYYRISDGPVSEQISSTCPKPPKVEITGKQKIVGVKNASGRKNLQLETFDVEQDNEPYPWLSSWCKPAIYLYPKQKANVHVAVAPKGEFMLTIPTYPKGGWDVTAYPDGKIVHNNTIYPYLYWEASIPDKLIHEPKQGYVVTHKELSGLFRGMLPKLGLNTKEASEFSTYWLKALPQSNFYFVGVMPQSDLNALAPLSIQPNPDSILRVTLYFKALEEKIDVTPPSLSSFTRKGFTVIEWGGFFKADRNHEGFTCLM